MYRTNMCGEIDKSFIGKTIQLAGWVRKKRDHGTILFLDLADATGIVQCITHNEVHKQRDEQSCEYTLNNDNDTFKTIDKLSLESVVSITGIIALRSIETINKNISSGEIELHVTKVEVLSAAQELPFALHQKDLSEELQLKYRFLHLRNSEMQNLLRLRTRVIDLMRQYMKEMNFLEIQTPILAASSPEGARDYLVPSRLHPGKFYALPQAPQQYKQMLMASGVEKYFQIAPCFRDEDSRADRLVGEFYQLDFEMAYATQEDVFDVLEYVLYNIFHTLKPDYKMATKFPRIPYKEAIERYGSDKPDLRNPLEIMDITNKFPTPNIFKKLVDEDGKLLVISAKLENVSGKFFETLQKTMQAKGAQGLAYAVLKNEWSGPLANMFGEKESMLQAPMHNAIFLIADKKDEAYKLIGQLRTELGTQLNLLDEKQFAFCLITDFPMFELNDGKWDFMHNPFSKPQNIDLPTADILSFQYDIVCNGYELASGAVRNHDLALVKKVFEKIDENAGDIEERFPLYKAFRYGVPPHAGCAPGIDRIIMLISGRHNVRDVVPFPLNQNGESSLMNSPSVVEERFLKDLKLNNEERRDDAGACVSKIK